MNDPDMQPIIYFPQDVDSLALQREIRYLLDQRYGMPDGPIVEQLEYITHAEQPPQTLEDYTRVMEQILAEAARRVREKREAQP